MNLRKVLMLSIFTILSLAITTTEIHARKIFVLAVAPGRSDVTTSMNGYTCMKGLRAWKTNITDIGEATVYELETSNSFSHGCFARPSKSVLHFYEKGQEISSAWIISSIAGIVVSPRSGVTIPPDLDCAELGDEIPGNYSCVILP